MQSIAKKFLKIFSFCYWYAGKGLNDKKNLGNTGFIAIFSQK